ncbi:hypothetical protein LCGC14_1858700 [marine sediment metagenome]|uniref:Uncharacterized protein n=1 Tax=marine sediment metagenome TaxID=412755 RepID=A0A0F9G8F0_9ZZZZ
MIWGLTHNKRRLKNALKDLWWFAWYPVRLANGQWIWLETVMRRVCCCWGGGAIIIIPNEIGSIPLNTLSLKHN